MNEELKKEMDEKSYCPDDVYASGAKISIDASEAKLLIDRATLAERKRIFKALRENWSRLMGASMVANMQGNIDEQWDKIFSAIEKGEEV